MSKLGCQCGGIIYDQTDRLPNKGLVLRDQHYMDVLEEISAEITSFLTAKLTQSENAWVQKRFTADYARLNLGDSEIIYDLISSRLLEIGLDLYQ